MRNLPDENAQAEQVSIRGMAFSGSWASSVLASQLDLPNSDTTHQALALPAIFCHMSKVGMEEAILD